MRKIGTVAAVFALAIVGLSVPATTAQADDAAAQGEGCDAAWPDAGRDGYMRAWFNYDCTGVFLGGSVGDDPNWADATGPFRGSDNDDATSVMNSGYIGGEDVVAFYLNTNYRAKDGYGCLAAGELYADDLSDNYYYDSDSGPTGITINNSISSHQWVYAGDCAGGSWIT